MAETHLTRCYDQRCRCRPTRRLRGYAMCSRHYLEALRHGANVQFVRVWGTRLLLGFLALLMLSVPAQAQDPLPRPTLAITSVKVSTVVLPLPVPVTSNTLTVTFDYDYSQPGSNGCATATQLSCVLNFQFFEQDSFTSNVAGATLLTIPAASGATTAQTGITGTVLVTALAPGNHTYGLVAATSDAVVSAPVFFGPVAVKSGIPTSVKNFVVGVR